MPLRVSLAFPWDNGNAWFVTSSHISLNIICHSRMQKGFLLSRWWQFFEYDLVFLETLSTRNAPIFSWESLSRSVIIDLGSSWNPGKCVLWLCVQYQVIVARQRRCCGQGLGYTLWGKRSDPCGWLKEIITQGLKGLQKKKTWWWAL